MALILKGLVIATDVGCAVRLVRIIIKQALQTFVPSTMTEINFVKSMVVRMMFVFVFLIIRGFVL